MKIKTPFRVLKKIYHISDIQIRNLKRHKEYEQVFDRLYEFIKRDDEGNSMIYIGGDIAHSKTDMSPELVDQLSRLFKNLADLCPTIIIAGNHDCNLNNRSRLDVLTPIVDNLKHPDLHYWKDTGIYYVGGVGFGVLDVWDDEANLPNPNDIESDTKVLLYHGTVDKAGTDLGFALPSDVKLKDFDGYDMVMLGDIHKMQTMQAYKPGKVTKPIVRYCGSLVQQNHGETLLGHGVSVWNVKSRTFEHQEIENDYGYYTMDIENGLVPKVKNMPKYARLRVRLSNTSNTDLKKALTVIRHRYNLKEVAVIRTDNTSTDSDTSALSIGDVTDPEHRASLICDYLKIKFPSISDETFDKIRKIDSDLNSMLVEESIQRNVNWKLKRFEFSNMFSYGEDNVIDFEKCNGVVGLFSANASGKSSILDALTFCLFDKSTRAWKAENIMNHSKSEFSCKLEFEIGDETYFIERYGRVAYRGNVKVDVNFYKIDRHGEQVSLNGDQRASTNKSIRGVIGTYEDFILTSFSSQTNSAVFLDHNQTERKEILSKFLGLSIFDQLYDLAMKESSGLQVMLKNFMDVDYDQQISDIESELTSVYKTLEKLEVSRDEKEKELDSCKEEIVTLLRSLRPVDPRIQSKEDLEENLSSVESDITSLQSLIKENKTKIETCQSDEEILINRLKSEKYQDIESKKVEYDALLDSKAAAQAEADSLKIEVSTKLDKIKKLGDLQYDQNCNFCMDNVFVKDAIKTKEELENDKARASQTVSKLKTIENKIQISADIPTRYDEYFELKNSLTSIASDVKLIKTNISSDEGKLSYQSKEKEYLLRNIKKHNESVKDIKYNDELNENIDKKRNEENIISTEMKAITADVQEYIGKRVQLETKKADIVKTIDSVKGLEVQYEAYKYYLEAVNKDGVSYDLISKILSTVEIEVNDILSQVVDFTLMFEMDGKMVNNYICYGDDKQWPLELASGMERFVSSLAIRIALTNISNLPRSNFLAIDEGFGSMDADNLNATYQLFQYLKTRFSFSLIISHIDAMRDFTDQLLEIKKEDGFSSINF
jgi:DNA repair exonuclease SbcCD ATPase subunit/predicted MPP superfamily phosphohydrolase